MLGWMRPSSSVRWLAATLALVPACAGSTVEYANGKCLIDGTSASLTQVEARQAEMTQHVLARQPILTAIVVAMVAIAIAGYLPRIFAILTARKAPVEKFGDRLRARIERYRAHPIRYFLLVGTLLAVLITGAVVYVALDADKRASERALANLQFCHLALRSATDHDHLKTIQSTEREIRALVAKLPAADARKAKNLADQLAKQQLAAGDDPKASDACTARLDALGKDIAAIRAQLDAMAGHAPQTTDSPHSDDGSRPDSPRPDSPRPGDGRPGDGSATPDATLAPAVDAGK